MVDMDGCGDQRAVGLAHFDSISPIFFARLASPGREFPFRALPSGDPDDDVDDRYYGLRHSIAPHSTLPRFHPRQLRYVANLERDFH